MLRMILTTVLACAWAGSVSADDQARQILDATGVQGGLIVHLGCGDGRLTAALRASDSYVVHGLDADAKNIEAAREHIRSLGLYGKVSAQPWTLPRLPYADNLVNLIVAEDLGQIPMAEVLRALCPNGVAYVKTGGQWTKTVKPRSAAIDEWTHFLHTPDNNAVARDRTIGPPQKLQWTAGPIWSRDHDVTPSVFAPVSAQGRLFYILEEGPISIVDSRLPEQHSLVARDAFNGVPLWKRPVSEWYSSQVIWGHIPVDAQRRLVVVGDRVYVTLGLQAPVTALDAATGATIREYAGTHETSEILYDQGLLVLVIRKTNPLQGALASRNRQRFTQAYPGPTGGGEALMAVRADTGECLWRTEHHCIPLTLAVSQGRVVFAQDEQVVCVDLHRGKTLWSAPRAAQTIVVHENVVLAASGNVGNKPIDLTALALDDGRELWTARNNCLPNFPTFFAPVDLFVVKGLAWGLAQDLIPSNASGNGSILGLDLHTGAVRQTIPVEGLFTAGHHVRCYKGKATERFLLFNKRGVEFLSLDSQEPSSQYPWVRGTCRYGILPCNGLLYAPPHACACYPGAKINGFYALAPLGAGATGEGRESQANRPASSERIERGPAFEERGQGTGDREQGKRKDQPSLGSSNPQFPIPNPSDWPTYRYDAARSGAAPAVPPSDLAPHWTTALSGPLSAPTAAEGKVFVASSDTHTVYALDGRTGRTVWHYTAGARVDSPPTICRGRALFGCRDGWVYCLRASDGALVWRFLAAPEQRLAGDSGQLESPWPVHGSVLVRDQVAYCAAGRSSFLDGGIRIYALSIADGKPLHELILSGPDPQRADIEKTASLMPGAVTDILTSDDTSLYMRHVPLDPQLSQPPAADALRYGVKSATHLIAQAGFLDDTLFNRYTWQYGPRVDRSQLLVFDKTAAFGLKVYSGISWNCPLFKPGEGYLVFRQELNKPVPAPPAASASGRKGARPPAGELNRIPYEAYTWHVRMPVRASAMLLAGQASAAGTSAAAARAGAGPRLFVAGAPDVIDPQDPTATFQGRSAGRLWVLSATDGAKLAELDLAAPPVWNGMATAGGRLYLVLRNGSVVCL